MKNYNETLNIKSLTNAELKSIEGGKCCEAWKWLGGVLGDFIDVAEDLGDYLINLETPTEYPVKRSLI